MENPYQNIDLGRYIGEFNSALADVIKNGKGSIICYTGESGFGKTYLLETISTICTGKNSGVHSCFIESQPPIGNFKIGKIQPLLPFRRAIEILMSDKDLTPEKRFAYQTAMTGLAVIPIIGEFFYAVKEISRDWRQFKREKSSESMKKISSVTAEFYDTLSALADKVPCVLIMDDMHWSDLQSIELLNLFAENINTIPLIIVISLRKSILLSQASPMLTFLEQYKVSRNVKIMDLQAFGKEEIGKLCRFYLSAYKNNPEFEEWLLEHTYGVPAVVSEYLKYFQQNSPFDKEGRLLNDFQTSDLLPTSLHSAFAQNIEKLSEEEKNILSICSAEGKEFTALIISELLNTDVLTTIKKLRSLQHRTGIIKSNGANYRYGVKTTVYQFTQAFYHNYFEKLLEYEEHVALHGHIAALLKQKYDDSEHEEVRNQIAPYIAAHSSEAGDEETTKSMLLQTARDAQDIGSNDVLKDIYDYFSNIEKPSSEPDDRTPDQLAFGEIFRNINHQKSDFSGEYENGEQISNQSTVANDVTFKDIRKAIVENFHSKKYNQAIELSRDVLDFRQDTLSDSEKSLLYLFISRNYLETDDISNAETYCDKAFTLTQNQNESMTECLVYNMYSIIRSAQNRKTEAEEYLKQAVEKVLKLPQELKLLTLANIGLLLKDINPLKSEKYMRLTGNLSNSLNFEEFHKDVFR
jgi:predicted ATPase